MNWVLLVNFMSATIKKIGFTNITVTVTTASMGLSLEGGTSIGTSFFFQLEKSEEGYQVPYTDHLVLMARLKEFAKSSP